MRKNLEKLPTIDPLTHKIIVGIAFLWIIFVGFIFLLGIFSRFA